MIFFPSTTFADLCSSLPTSLLSSLLNLIFEVYAIIRLVFLLAPSFLMGHHRWDALQDIRLAMALSLLLMDLLTVVPDAIPVSIAAEYIPFSVAAVIVLGKYVGRILTLYSFFTSHF